MAQQSVRRGWDNQGFPQCFEHAWVIWTRSANSHTGRRLSSCRIEGRTDDSIRPRAATIPTFSLAQKGASTDGKASRANAINNSGIIVGEADTDQTDAGGSFVTRAFRKDASGGGMVDLGSLDNGWSKALDINDNKGAIVGVSSFGPGTESGFLIPPGGQMTKLDFDVALSINNAGVIAGGGSASSGVGGADVFGVGGWGASLIDSNGSETQLFGSSSTNGNTLVWSLNDNIEAVGSLTHGVAMFEGFDAVYWDGSSNDPPLLSLSDLVDPVSQAWDLSSAHDINNSGQIIGTRGMPKVPDWFAQGPHYPTSGFILTPVFSPPRPPLRSALAFVYIIAGIIGDGGGIFTTPDGKIHIQGPGGGPGDPGPNLRWDALAPEKRDILAGLAIDEIAELIVDPVARQTTRQAALALVQKSAAGLAAGAQIGATVPALRSSLRRAGGGPASWIDARWSLRQKKQV